MMAYTNQASVQVTTGYNNLELVYWESLGDYNQAKELLEEVDCKQIP